MKPQQATGKTHSETLDYIRSMLGQLRIMAEAEHCDMLAYLIEMAVIEASDVARGERPARIGAESSGSKVHERDASA